MLDPRIIDILILLSLLMACYAVKFHNFRVIAFAVITITCLIASLAFPARPFHALFQATYLTALLLSSPGKSIKSCPIFKLSVAIAAGSFLFVIPTMLGINSLYYIERIVYFIRNFAVYAVLITTAIDFYDEPRRIFPYIFIGSWFVVSDIVKLMSTDNIGLVSNLYYTLDPLATHIFHIMLLVSVTLLGKQRESVREPEGVLT